ncbi:heterokaryon incompatibility protein-domain-containing protein [Phaeosphaeriaceae sp. PMI808]|nr:heterokaryon incompatibility protein-domain-containing protein [Phaeosphaeriaceae sp. PMI808]
MLQILREYVALSHCWGNLSVKEEEHCTTQDNIGQRQQLKGFSLSILPKTFQDAVKVTRELGVLYLWIDSLCIIQSGDKGEDWERESGQMESIFSHAYCTIAATAAVDSNARFLRRDVNPGYVHVQDASGKQFYISADIDDFDNDVGKAQLNTRAWVLQEGVLARRTIHFSANQTYWECGKGVYCENLTRLERNLLWQASNDKMKEIAYDHHVPSWSWMAYSGGIQFMDIPLGEVDWIDHLRFDECECDYAISSNLWTFQNCTMGPYEAQYAVLDSDGAKRGWIQYDVEGSKDLRKEQCVVVGRKINSGIQEYYVLVVRPTSVDGEYRRVGVGLIRSDCVVGQRINVRVV